jgi:hypothetical protein
MKTPKAAQQTVKAAQKNQKQAGMKTQSRVRAGMRPIGFFRA